MAEFWYDMNRAGVMEITKSPEVQAALQELADAKAAEANNLLAAHNPNPMGYQYAPTVKVLGRTAIGAVQTTGFTTMRDHLKHQTLNAINH